MSIVLQKKINEGPRRAIFHFYFESDGISGELDNYLLIDPAVDFNPTPDGVLQFSITKLWYGAAVFDMVLKFNAIEPYPVWVIVPDADSHICFDYMGGLQDYSTEQPDGKLLISTNGFAVPGSVGTLLIEVKKT